MKLAKLIKSSLGATVLISLATAYKADALTFNLSYSSSITSASNAATIEAATQEVANFYSELFTNPVTLNININTMSNGLGESNVNLQLYYSYKTVRNALITNDPALYQSSSPSTSSLPTTNPAPSNNFFITNAEVKALGLGNPTGIDGTFSISTSQKYTFCTTTVTCSIASGTYDYDAIVEHEFSEIMGRISSLGDNFGNGPTYDPYDLFRFTGKGVRNFSPSTSAKVYFSTNNGATNLKTFNDPHGNGSDPQDWANGTNDAFNAFSNSRVVNAFSSVDLTAMNTIGWKTNGSGTSVISSSAWNSTKLGTVGSAVGAVPDPLVLLGAALGGGMFLGVSALMRRKSI